MRQKITISRLEKEGFNKKVKGSLTYYSKGTFFVTSGLKNWSYGWEEGDPVISQLSQIEFMDEIQPLINAGKKK